MNQRTVYVLVGVIARRDPAILCRGLAALLRAGEPGRAISWESRGMDLGDDDPRGPGHTMSGISVVLETQRTREELRERARPLRDAEGVADVFYSIELHELPMARSAAFWGAMDGDDPHGTLRGLADEYPPMGGSVLLLPHMPIRLDLP